MATIFSDTFTGANGTTITAHNAVWNAEDGVAQILANNRARVNGAGGSNYSNTTVTGTADYQVSADIYVADSSYANYAPGVSARHNGTTTYYHARYSGPTVAWELNKVVGGAFTLLASVAADPLVVGNSYSLRLVCEGSLIEVYKEGEASPIISTTDTSIASGTSGLRNRLASGSPGDAVGLHIDNFVASTLPTEIALDPGSFALTGGALSFAVTTPLAPGTFTLTGGSLEFSTGDEPEPVRRAAFGRYAAQIDRKWYFFDDPKDIEELLKEDAKEEAEAIRKAKPRAKIVVKPGVVRQIVQQAAQEVPAQATYQQIERAQHAVRQMYRRAYAQAMQAIEQDEEDALMVLL